MDTLFRKLKAQAQGRSGTRATEPNHDTASSHTIEHRPYLLLLQHSLSSSLRQQAATSDATDADVTVYRRAGVRTPSESAGRDLEGGSGLWLKYLTQLLEDTLDHVVWIRTCPRRIPAWLESTDRIHVIDAAADPFGWSDSSESGCPQITLENLNSILDALVDHVASLPDQADASCIPCGLVMDSVTPLVQRHGVSQCVRFLRRLRAMPFVTILVPVLSETMTAPEHAALEGMAEALLRIRGGEAVLLRKGVRERDNVLRESLAFDIVTEPTTGLRTLRVSSLSQSQAGPQEKVKGPDDSEQVTKRHGTAARPKVELRLAEDPRAKPLSTTQQPTPSLTRLAVTESSEAGAPRIFMEDNDPEFDDYDEEDPDDDLDL